MKADIKEFLEEAEKSLILVKNDIAANIYGDLLMNSPIWSGQYIKSHRIGKGKPDPTHEKVYNLPMDLWITTRIGNAARVALHSKLLYAGLAKIAGINKLKTDIFLSNSIPYAAIVEYIGSFKKSAHLVYTMAVQNASLLSQIYPTQRTNPSPLLTAPPKIRNDL